VNTRTPSKLVRLPSCSVQPSILDRMARLAGMTALTRCHLIRLALDLGLTVLEREQANGNNDEDRP
jgi:hypothetical protein